MSAREDDVDEMEDEDALMELREDRSVDLDPPVRALDLLKSKTQIMAGWQKGYPEV